MPAVPIIALAASAAATGYSVITAKKASDAAAANDQATAQYNAKVDQQQAQQLNVNTQTNIEGMRRDASVYMSRQAAAYAGAGIVANTGSALAVQVATAGKFAMREQQAWADSQAQEQLLAGGAAEGVREGDAAATAANSQGIAAMINGASKLSSTLYGGYQSGVFSFGSTGSNDLSAGLEAP